MNKDEGIAKSPVECSVKRLISPPQESQHAKRSRNANPLAQMGSSLIVMRPVKTPHFFRDQPEGHSGGTEVVINDNGNKMTSLESVWKSDTEVKNKNERDSGFTLITEQKATKAEASENPNTHLDMDTHTLTAHKHRHSEKAITYTMQRNAEEVETDPNKRGVISTAKSSSKGNQDSRMLSDEERAEGMLTHLVTFNCCRHNNIFD